MKGLNIFIGIMVVLILVILSFVGWDKYRQDKAVKLAEKYLSAVKSEDCDKALTCLVAYKGDGNQRVEVDPLKAKDIYKKKTDVLREMNYKLIDYKNVKAQKEDYVLYVTATIKVQYNGKTIEGEEQYQFTPDIGKIISVESFDDLYAQYRNGIMEYYDIHYKGQLAIKALVENADTFKGFGETPSSRGVYAKDGKTLGEFVQAIAKAEKVEEKVDLNHPNYRVRMTFLNNKQMDLRFWVNKEDIRFVFEENPNTVYKFSKDTFPAENNLFDIVELLSKRSMLSK